MATSPAKALFALAAIAAIIELAAATNYTVGSPSGSWDLRTNLSTWASNISFKSGDNLIFSYSPSLHDVLEVTKSNYDSCSTSGPIKTHNTGNDVIPLNSTGKRYFICGFSGHCASGMKLQIDTSAPSTGSPPPSSSPSPSSSPPPSGGPPSTPSTPNAPLTPEGSPSGTPGGSTPNTPPSAASRSLVGKVAVAGLIGVGMLMEFAL